MAQDSDSSNNAKSTEVDLDDIELDILVLAKNPHTLKPTSTFLARRGWPTTVIGNISKAIEYIAEKRPDFVLISFNHPSPSVVKLPELIAQTFNLTCIGFMEQSDALSTQKLTQIKLRHKVFGKPSGPNFQRTIRRILGEKLNIKFEDRNGEDGANDKANQGSVTIRGGKTAAGGSTLVQKQEMGEGSNSFFSTSDPENDDGGTVWDASGNPVTPAKGLHLVEGTDRTPNHQLNQENGIDPLSGSAFQQSANKTGGMSSVQSDPSSPERKSRNASGGKRKRLKDITGNDGARDAAGNLLVGKNVDPLQMAGAPSPDLVGMLKKSLFGEMGETEASASTEAAEAATDAVQAAAQSIFEKAAEAGLVQVCVAAPGVPVAPLHMASKVGVFPIDSPSSPGYLVLALETPLPEAQQNFLKSCETSLLASFHSLNVPGKVESGFWLDLPKVPFEPWAEAAGTFNFKLEHQGAQLGVVFFPTLKPLVKARPTGEQGMYLIEIDEISTDQPVNFKAYLRLEKNQKFYLYLRNGRQLQPEQKRRLQERLVKEIYMKSVDLENLRIYLAGSFLIGSIKANEEAA